MLHTKSSLAQPAAQKFGFVELFTVVYFAHKLLPVVGLYMPSIVYLGVFAVLAFLLIPVFQLKKTGAVFGFLAVSLLALIPKLSNLNGALLFVYGELQLVLYGLIALYIINKKGAYSCRRLLLLIALMYLVTTITTYVSTFTYPQASRIMATLSSDDALYQFYVKKNIGSFAFVYELVLLTPLLLYVTRKKILHPILGCALLVLIGLTVIATEYGMAVLLFFASLLLLVIPRLTAKKIVVLLIVLVLIVAVFGGLLADGFENLSRSINSETLSERFLAVAETLRGEDQLSSSTGSNRIELYGKSLNSFVDSLFLGTWGGGIGGHSFVFDTLGSYGIIGILALLLVFRAVYVLCLKPYRDQPFYPYLLWSVMLLVVMSTLNPKIYPFIFLCVLPLFGEAFRSDKKDGAL